ncbi:MAG: TonB-dependent receptor domain-containing protein, partial [Methylococcales bacterium]
MAASIPSDVLAKFPPGFTAITLAQAAVKFRIDPVINGVTGAPDIDNVDSNENHTVGYIYSISEILDRLTLTLGGSINSIDFTSNSGLLTEFNPIYVNPKAGVIWQPFKNTVLRAAWFQSSKRPFGANQTLEPTSVAGFNQFFDDPENTRSTRYGFGINQVLSSNLTIGGELSWRKLKIPPELVLGGALIPNSFQDEENHRAYAYWTPTSNLALSAEYFFESFDRGPRISIDQGTPLKTRAHRVPLSVNYFLDNGLFANFVANYIDQHVTLRSNNINNVDTPRDSSFWVFDSTIGYRLPNRLGILNFGIKNIFDRKFNFQDTNFNVVGAIEGDFLPPLFVPERT